jgi:hypothetical protein
MFLIPFFFCADQEPSMKKPTKKSCFLESCFLKSNSQFLEFSVCKNSFCVVNHRTTVNNQNQMWSSRCGQNVVRTLFLSLETRLNTGFHHFMLLSVGKP